MLIKIKMEYYLIAIFDMIGYMFVFGGYGFFFGGLIGIVAGIVIWRYDRKGDYDKFKR